MHQAIEDFQRTIESDVEILRLMKDMFAEIPQHRSFSQDPLGKPRASNYRDLLEAFDTTITKAPEWNGENPGVKCLPFSALLDWPLSTKSGRACFHNEKVNTCIRAVFAAWTDFLDSERSAYVLNDSPLGWFCRSAQAFVMCDTADQSNRQFEKEFACNESKPWESYPTWNAFFTRAFHPGVRPVAAPDDANVIVNACEAAPFRLASDVQIHDTFWLKEQPYSLQDMFADHPLAIQFAGGTVYQGFLNAGSYHRWHSPVNGHIVALHMQPSLYFAKPERMSASGYDDTGFDPTDPIESQAYIAQVSSRAMIFIEADNPSIGLMCVMPVGWVEASSCKITVREQEHVIKGEQLGMFRFGGSTHCLIFRPGVRLRWDLRGQTPGSSTLILPVNSALAVIEEPERVSFQETLRPKL